MFPNVWVRHYLYQFCVGIYDIVDTVFWKEKEIFLPAKFSLFSFFLLSFFAYTERSKRTTYFKNNQFHIILWNHLSLYKQGPDNARKSKKYPYFNLLTCHHTKGCCSRPKTSTSCYVIFLLCFYFQCLESLTERTWT